MTDTTQSALSKAHLSGTAGFDFPYLIEAVVVGIHYKADKTNRSKKEIEYDIDPTSMFNLGRMRNVPRVDVMAGIDDGDDNILQVAKAAVANKKFVSDGSKNSNDKPTPRYETTGDRVLVGFVNGNPYRPVIVGVLTHFYSRREFKKMDGTELPTGGKKIRRSRHRGTEVVRDEKGNVDIVFGKVPDDQGKDTSDSEKKVLSITIGDFVVTIDNSSSPTTANFKGPDGNVFKLTKDGLELGVSPSDHMALAKLVKDEVTALRNTVDALVSTCNTNFTTIKTHGHPAIVAPSPALAAMGSASAPASVNDVKSAFVKSK